LAKRNDGEDDMNFSKQTSMMAALFLSLGLGVPAIAAGAKGASSARSGVTTSPSTVPSTVPSAMGSGSAHERSPENTQTQAEPTQDANSAGALGVGARSDSLDSGRSQAAGADHRGSNKMSRSHGTASVSDHHAAGLAQHDRETIMDLQTALQAEGLYQGSVDGVAGRQTQRALREYQQARQLDATGRLDVETMRQLGVGGAGDDVQPVRGLDSPTSPGAMDSGSMGSSGRTVSPGAGVGAGSGTGIGGGSVGSGSVGAGSSGSGTDSLGGTGTLGGSSVGGGIGAGSQGSTGSGTGAEMGTGSGTSRTGSGSGSTGSGSGSMGTGSGSNGAGSTGTGSSSAGTRSGSGSMGSGSGSTHGGSGSHSGSGTHGTGTHGGSGTHGGTGSDSLGGTGTGAGTGSGAGSTGSSTGSSGARTRGAGESIINPSGTTSGGSAVPGGASAPVQP